MKINKKVGQHNLKILRRFQEDITGTLGLRNKPSNILDYIFEAYQNNFKYKNKTVFNGSTRKYLFNKCFAHRTSM